MATKERGYEIDTGKLLELFSQCGITDTRTIAALCGYSDPACFTKIKRGARMDRSKAEAAARYLRCKVNDFIFQAKPEPAAKESEPTPIDYDELARAIWRNAPDFTENIITAITSADLTRSIAKAVAEGTKNGIKEARRDREQRKEN